MHRTPQSIPGLTTISGLRADTESRGSHAELARATPTSDAEIRAAIHAALRNDPAYSTSVVVDELRLNVGIVRADIAVAAAEHFWIIEIKSDRDSLLRLSSQQRCYDQLADHVTLVVGWRLSVRALRASPPWWELWLAERRPDSSISLIPLRDPAPNPSNKRFVMARMLPTSRALKLLRAHSANHMKMPRSRDAIAERLVDSVSLPILRQEVSEFLRKRESLGLVAQPDANYRWSHTD